MENIKKKKGFPLDTAGSLMTVQVPLVLEEQTIAEVQQLLFKKIGAFKTINYFYVVDRKERLKGVFSVKEIFHYPKNKKIADIMAKKIISCRAFADQKRVAILALRNNLKAIPVVNKDNKFLGVVTSDTILNVLHKEHIEDILLAGGISKLDDSIKALTTASVNLIVKARLPWLLFGLLGGVVTAQIIGFFENVLASQILLALFIPVIVYISDAVATQTETLIIRGMAIDPKISVRQYFFRELKIGSFLALILGVILAFIAFFWWQESTLAVILGLSLFCGISLSVIVATLVPLLLERLKKDPAMGSGPFATIITDVLSITVYFLIATLLLKIL